jgi:hypothetical protein
MSRRRTGGAMIEFLERTDIENNAALQVRLPADMEDYALGPPRAGAIGPRGPPPPRRLAGGGASARPRQDAAAPRDRRARLVQPGRRRRGRTGRRRRRVSRDQRGASLDVLHRSLAAALREAGCVEPRLCGPSECAIPAFASYDLDTIGPRVRKPGALFAEGIKRA